MQIRDYTGHGSFASTWQLFRLINNYLLWVTVFVASASMIKMFFVGGTAELLLLPLPIMLALVKFSKERMAVGLSAFLISVTLATTALAMVHVTENLAIGYLVALLLPMLMRFFLNRLLTLAFIPFWVVLLAATSHVDTMHVGGLPIFHDSDSLYHFMAIMFALSAYFLIAVLFDYLYQYAARREREASNNLAQGLLDSDQLNAHFKWLRGKNSDSSVRVYGVRVLGLVAKSSEFSTNAKLVASFNELLRSRLPTGISIGRLVDGTYILMAERIYWDAFESGLRTLMNESIDSDGVSVSIEPIVVSSDSPIDGANLSTLLDNLSVVFKRAKEEQRNFARFTLVDLNHHTPERKFEVSELLEAIDTGQVSMFFQPKIDIQKNNILVGAEALVRWFHPTLGALSPVEFVDEMSRSVVRLNFLRLVIRESAYFCEVMRQSGNPIVVSFNLTANDIQDLRVARELQMTQDMYHFPDGLLQIEVSERETTVSLDSLKRALMAIRELGYSVSLDDFGTGMSSLAYFQSLPVDTIKLDRCFVHDLHLNASSEQVVRMITSLSQEAGRSVVAEGAEVAAEVNYLRDIGVNEVQGFYFGKPMSMDDFLTTYHIEFSEDPDDLPS